MGVARAQRPDDFEGRFEIFRVLVQPLVAAVIDLIVLGITFGVVVSAIDSLVLFCAVLSSSSLLGFKLLRQIQTVAGVVLCCIQPG